MMNTHIFSAYKLSTALVFAALTTVWLPVSPVYAAQNTTVNSQAPRYGYYKKQPVITEAPAAESVSTVAPSETPAASTASTTSAVTSTSSVATAAPQTQKSPHGNNGFIKVNEETIPDSIPNNDPHVSCTFKVEFYNYDHNPAYRARVAFTLQNPTAGAGYSLTTEGNLRPLIGNDGATGGNDLDAVETYKLAFTGMPHTQQGYHVKLTIHADGSRGADVKHKVFWVKPCPPTVGTVASEGHVLSTSTTMPSKLPSTGSSNLSGFAVTSLASLVTYALAFRFQKSREY